MKTCTKCKKSLDESNFTKRKSRSNHLYSWCKKCTQNIVKECRKDLKKQAVEYKGGLCSSCGYNKCIRSLSFHHNNPKEKDFGISKGGSITFSKIKDELDKCTLLCMNCHMELHERLGID